MNWLLEIFENNSDKARLIAILISTAAAFTLFLLNQHFQTKREKKKHLVEKVEELYKAVLGLEYSAMDYMDETHSFVGLRLPGSAQDKASKAESDFKEQIYQIRMLTGLYFSHITEFSEDGFESRLYALIAKMENLANARSAGPSDYDPIYGELEKILQSLKSGCISANKMYKY